MEPQAQASQFDMLHGGSRLSVFLYETEHPPEALSNPTYFMSVAGRLRRNDVIVACAGAGKAPTWGLFMVRQIRPDAVLLEDLNAFQAERIGAFAMLRRPPGRSGGDAPKPATQGARGRAGARARKTTRTGKKN